MATKKPFVLKLKTNHIKVCQSCCKNYDGVNDTLGLVVARAERRLICNLATGIQFLGKESNSHYHLHLSRLKSADVSFTGMVPDDIKPALSAVQKMYLATYRFCNTKLFASELDFRCTCVYVHVYVYIAHSLIIIHFEAIYPIFSYFLFPYF